MKSIYRTILAVAGSFLAAQFGGWDAALETLGCFMAIDWITGGVLLPVVFKKSPKSENGTLESRAGWKGLCRKGMMLFFVLVGKTGSAHTDELPAGCRLHWIYFK